MAASPFSTKRGAIGNSCPKPLSTTASTSEKPPWLQFPAATAGSRSAKRLLLPQYRHVTPRRPLPLPPRLCRCSHGLRRLPPLGHRQWLVPRRRPPPPPRRPHPPVAANNPLRHRRKSASRDSIPTRLRKSAPPPIWGLSINPLKNELIGTLAGMASFVQN